MAFTTVVALAARSIGDAQIAPRSSICRSPANLRQAATAATHGVPLSRTFFGNSLHNDNNSLPRRSPAAIAVRADRSLLVRAEGVPQLAGEDLARRIAQISDAAKCEAICILREPRAVKEAFSPFSYAVLATAFSKAQINAVIGRLERELQRKPKSVEGDAASGWALLDYGGVVLHVFSAAERDRYDLEGLYQFAEEVPFESLPSAPRPSDRREGGARKDPFANW